MNWDVVKSIDEIQILARKYNLHADDLIKNRTFDVRFFYGAGVCRENYVGLLVFEIKTT